MRKIKKLSGLPLVVLVFTLLVALSGCAVTQQSFIAEGVDLGYVERIAILPLENNTDDTFAAERVRDILSTSILAQGYYNVVEKGNLARFLNEEVASDKGTLLDKSVAQRLGKDLKVDAYIAGAIDDYRQVSNGPYSYWVVAATLRLVDIKSGEIIWQASGTESGYNTFQRLFGFASQDSNQVSLRLVQRLLNTIQ